MSTTKTQRIVSLVLALMFLVSTLGVGIFYLLVDSGQNQQTTTQTNIGGETLQGTKLSNFTPIASVSTLQAIDTIPGTGAEVKAGDTVTVHYTGALAKDGTIFESSLDSGQPVTFGLDQVIEGWQQGIPGMKESGTRRLIIPADLAYGNQATGSIPANSALVFDVQLIKIGN